MRAQMASALLVGFGVLSFVHSAAAQSSPIRPQPRQETQEKSPSDAKPLPLPPATQIVLLPRQIGSANDPTITQQELKTRIELLQNLKARLATQILGNGLDTANCGHIRIIQAPEMDSEMVVQMSAGDGGPIQAFQGLPPCRRDLPAPMAVQRFDGARPMLLVPPRRPFVQPPALQIPSAQPTRGEHP
jgi:hypothetical protein